MSSAPGVGWSGGFLIAFALIESLAYETVCEEGKIDDLVPKPVAARLKEELAR